MTATTHDLTLGEHEVVKTFRSWDRDEPGREWHAGVMDAEELISQLDLESGQRIRLHRMRRLFATFWLYMLLPGSPAHHRNPPGSVERQAERVLGLMG